MLELFIFTFFEFAYLILSNYYLGHMTLLGQKFEKASGWLINQLQTPCVVGEGYVRELDFFCGILNIHRISFNAEIWTSYRFLFYFEYIVVEEHMQLFIGVVDAKLFKRICRKVFKSKNV